MTEREKLIEVMARAQCSQGGFDPNEMMPNDGQRWSYYVPGVTAALTALEASGVRLVPVEATEEMLVDGTETWLCEAAMEDRAGVCWSAMLAASPYAPEAEG